MITFKRWVTPVFFPYVSATSKVIVWSAEKVQRAGLLSVKLPSGGIGYLPSIMAVTSPELK